MLKTNHDRYNIDDILLNYYNINPISRDIGLRLVSQIFYTQTIIPLDEFLVSSPGTRETREAVDDRAPSDLLAKLVS